MLGRSITRKQHLLSLRGEHMMHLSYDRRTRQSSNHLMVKRGNYVC